MKNRIESEVARERNAALLKTPEGREMYLARLVSLARADATARGSRGGRGFRLADDRRSSHGKSGDGPLSR